MQNAIRVLESDLAMAKEFLVICERGLGFSERFEKTVKEAKEYIAEIEQAITILKAIR